jgi:hypothetical protein
MQTKFSDKQVTYYEHEGIFFRVCQSARDICGLTEEEIEKTILNAKDYLPKHCDKSFDELKQRPLPLFDVDKFDVSALNMSIFEYEVLVKGITDVAPALKSACIQQYSENTIIIACEPWDDESDLTPKNRKIIKEYIKEHEKELLSVTGRTDLDIEWWD